MCSSHFARHFTIAVKGRDVTNGLIALKDVIDYVQLNHHDAYVLSINFYKAFDCIDDCFLFKIMKKFVFSEYFCHTIFNLLKNSETTVIINGFSSDYFPVKREVCQEDPLSLNLFLLFLEPLLRCFNTDNGIGGNFYSGFARLCLEVYCLC